MWWLMGRGRYWWSVVGRGTPWLVVLVVGGVVGVVHGGGHMVVGVDGRRHPTTEAWLFSSRHHMRFPMKVRIPLERLVY
jgi:hypothetical protein